MTLPSFATLKVLATVALLAAVAGVSTQGQAQVSVYHDGVDVDTDGLSDAAEKETCPTPSHGAIVAGYLDDRTTFPGTPERMTVVRWGDWNGWSAMNVGWPRGVDNKYADCVQKIRMIVDIIDTTEAIPNCKPIVARSFRFEGGIRHEYHLRYNVISGNWEYENLMQLYSYGVPDVEVVYYGTDGSGAPSWEDIAPDDGWLDADDGRVGGGLVGDGPAGMTDVPDVTGVTDMIDAIGKKPCARAISQVQIKARGWYLPKKTAANPTPTWVKIPDGACYMRIYDVQTLPGSEPTYNRWGDDSGSC